MRVQAAGSGAPDDADPPTVPLVRVTPLSCTYRNKPEVAWLHGVWWLHIVFGWATDLHVRTFPECVRTRQTPTAPMKLGFQAALVVQMANLSLKNGRRMRWHGEQAV